MTRVAATGIALVPGSSHPALSWRIGESLGLEPIDVRTRCFPDGELDVSVDPVVRGFDAYLVQSLGPPVNEHLIELLLLVDACRRAGARRITAILPYLGYARKDRRTDLGDAVGLAMVADLLGPARVDRAVIVDPHVAQVDSIFTVPLEVVSAVPVVASALRDEAGDHSSGHVVVAPDLGAAALAERYAMELGVDEMSVVRKTRLSGSEVTVTGVVGDGVDRSPLIVDDMISTGGTITAAVDVLRAEWNASEITVAATHGVFVDGAVDDLMELPIRRLMITDSLPNDDLPESVTVVGLAERLAETIERIAGPM